MSVSNFSINMREDFPILAKKIHDKPLIYFDSAATSQKPKQVIDAITKFYSEEYGTVHRAVYQLAASATNEYQKVREKVRAFLNAKRTDEIIFTRGTTDSINLLAKSFGNAFINEGDEIIISEMEHHSNIVPWQMLCKERGAKLKIISINDDCELLLDEYRSLLTPRTKLVAVAHIANSTGTFNPIKEMTELAHRAGAKIFIDGAQSAAHIPVDVEELDIDFFAFSGHKAYGPTGIGVLYGKKELLDLMPPVQGGGDMIETVTLKHSTYQPTPLKFEAGTPMIAQVIGLGAALNYLEKQDLKHIAHIEMELLNDATEKLLQVPDLRIIGTAQEKGPIISFIIENIHHLDLATMLDLEGIAMRSGHHCAQPLLQRFGLSGTCRISFAPFNTTEEIDLFMIALEKSVQRLKP